MIGSDSSSKVNVKLTMATERDFDKFNKDGFLVIEDFISQSDVEALKSECWNLVNEMDPAEHNTIFSTTKQSYRDDYFLNSGDKIRYFFEESAKNEKGELIVDKHKSLNKIGHALHLLCPKFKEVTFHERVQQIAKQFGYQNPVVPQSMYIFKQPGIGGEVVPHQDATYLFVEPLKVMGFWIALEDATEENGCLWFIPGSHKGGLYGDYRMVRNTNQEGPSCIYTGTKPTYDNSKFVPVPVKKGSLILIDGLVVHQSEKNTSAKSRHIYTFHIFDQGKWSEQNWLQPTEAMPFPKLLKN